MLAEIARPVEVVVARGGKNRRARGQRDEVSLEDDDLDVERHRIHHVGEIPGERNDVDVFSGPHQPVVVRQPVMQIRGHQDAHALILPYFCFAGD